MVRLTIGDGREGREGGRAGVTPSGKGAILHTMERNAPLDQGDVFDLPNGGGRVVVIGLEEKIGPDGWEQTVYVDDLD